MWADSSVVRAEDAGEMLQCLGFSLKLLQQRKKAQGRREGEGEGDCTRQEVALKGQLLNLDDG